MFLPVLFLKDQDVLKCFAFTDHALDCLLRRQLKAQTFCGLQGGPGFGPGGLLQQPRPSYPPMGQVLPSHPLPCRL